MVTETDLETLAVEICDAIGPEDEFFVLTFAGAAQYYCLAEGLTQERYWDHVVDMTFENDTHEEIFTAKVRPLMENRNTILSLAIKVQNIANENVKALSA